MADLKYWLGKGKHIFGRWYRDDLPIMIELHLLMKGRRNNSLLVLSYALIVWVEGLKSECTKPRAITVAKWQTFRVEPLSNITNGTMWLEQPTEIYRGRMWSKPLGGKSSSENTMQVVLPDVIIWINPFGVVIVSTLIWLKARIKASLWVLDDANKL